jgi:predicted amidohydrolase YtcJ
MAPMKEVCVQLRGRFFALAVWLTSVALATGATAQQSVRLRPADIIIHHARIFTVDEKKPWAQSLAIYKGKIVLVGSDDEVSRMRGIGTKMIDAGGKVVLPGFTDCHVHFIGGGLGLRRLNLEGAANVAEIQRRLRAYAAQHTDQEWILGRGWNYAMFTPETLPHKKYLDEILSDRPVFLRAYDGHTSWANSRALAMAGIIRSTPNPPNGEIVRDPQTGEPTGALKESAGALVGKIVPKPDHVEQLNALRAGIKWASQNGITRVHSAGGDFEELDLLEELRDEGQLSARFHVAYLLEPPELRPQDLSAIEAARKRFHDEWIDVNTVKFMLDGVVESHTAAFLEPYTDDRATKGSLFWEPEKYKAAVAELDKRGLQLYTHAIGDYAVRTALDAYEFAEQKNHTKDRRGRVEHIETIAASDVPRFGKLGVIASMQPLHSYPDADTLDVWARNIGPERAGRAWVWKSIAQSGGQYAFGSDWPVVTLNPWQGIQTAVTRQTSEGEPADGFVPAQRLTVAQAVAGYTLNAAFAGHLEKTEGSLEVGKAADMIMLDRNIFEVDPHTIDQTKVVLTLVGGKIVYEADAR